MTQRKSVLAAAAVSALLAQAPTFAASSSSASLSNLTITLYDLNPFDGVSSSISFAGLSYSYASGYSPGFGSASDGYNLGTAAFDTVSSHVSIGMASANASSTGDSQTTYSGASSTLVGSLNASGQANGGAPSIDLSSYTGQSYWNGYTSNAFTLTANTLVVFTAMGNTSAAVTHGYTSTPYDYEYGQANVSLTISGQSSSGTGNQQSSDSLQSYVNNWTIYDGNQYVPGSDNKIGNLGVSFLNATGGNLEGTFYASATVDGYSYAPSVPEPESYALMLAGLGALGFLGRRRKVAASKA